MNKRIKYWVLPILLVQGLLLTSSDDAFAGGACCSTCAFGLPGVTLASTTGCNATTYTFTQKTPNKDDASITANTTRVCTIDFPAGTDATTATVAGSTMDGVAIGSFSTQTATQLIFTIPPGVAIGINTQFLIVIANVTNGDGLASNCSVTANGDVCDITGINAYALTTTACPGTCSDAILNQDETGPADCGGVCGGDATANAGADATLCNAATHTLSGATVGGTATTQTWTTSGDGTFSSTTALNPTYTPGTTDINSGTVTLTITTDDPAGICLAAADAMTLTIDGCGACNVAAGDIAITGFNADNLPVDQFSIVVLTTLAAGEEIFFTDNGWLAAGGFRTGEGVLTWTVPAGGLTCGTEVTFTDNTPWSVTAGTVSLSGSFLLNTTGESIIAYTGTLTCPTNIFAINNVGGGGWDADASDAQTSALPSGLTDGTNAISLVHIDNSKYNCSTSSGSAAALLAAIANSANWAGDNSAQVSLPPTCTFSCACPEPSTAPDAPTFSNVSATSFDISWANGGPNYLVVVKSGSAVLNDPADGSTYTANTTFGSGSDLGGGEYVVYDGTGTTVSVTGLTCGTTYHVEIFSHDCTPQNYKIDAGGVSSQATSSEPGTAPDVPTFANLAAVSFDINWANGGPNYLVVVKSGSVVLNDPADGSTYTANTTFGSGSDLGGGEYVVYDGTGTTVSIAGLTCGTTYHVEIFSYDCSPQDYKTDVGGVSNQATTVCGASRWSLGATGTIVRTRATSSDTWQNQYDGGIATIPATASWILRETAATGSPTISSTNGGGAYYPILIIENVTGTPWITTGTASAFSGSAAFPTIKGNLDIGGTGGGAVTFENSNTNATRTSVLGDVIVRSGHTLQNNGSGFDIQGNLNVIGTITYDADGGRGLQFSGGNAQSILGAGTLNIYDMFINKSADKVTLNRVITVDNQLTLTSGELTLNSNTLTITNAATTAITGGSATAYINSEAEISFVQWNTDATAGTYIYPFGFSGSYIPFTFAKNAATATNVSVSTWTTSVDNQTNIPTGVTLNATDGTDKFIDRWWDVDPSVTLSATLTFSWTTSETSGVDYTTTPISFHWNGTSFDEITATAGTENITSTWTSYSHGGGGGGGAPLPIDLISFDAKYNKNTADVDLTWVTASETNNDYFTIEKSQDATDFDIVVTEPGAGNSNVILTYKTIDPAPYLNTSFYRLKQTDYDGQYKYSNMVAVKITPKEKLRIWPNPVADILSISFASEATTASVKEESGYTISIYDTQGQLVKRGNHDSDKSELKINVSELSEGLYVLEISREGQIHKVQFTKAPN